MNVTSRGQFTAGVRAIHSTKSIFKQYNINHVNDNEKEDTTADHRSTIRFDYNYCNKYFTEGNSIRSTMIKHNALLTYIDVYGITSDTES